MHQSTLLSVLAALAAIGAAVPAPQATPPGTYINYGFSDDDDSSDNSKRAALAQDVPPGEYTNYGFSDIGSDDSKRSLAERDSNYISSCGDTWMYVDDDSNGQYLGYNTAVTSWCYHITHSEDGLPSVISAGQKLAGLIQGGFQLSHGGAGSVECELLLVPLSCPTPSITDYFFDGYVMLIGD